eukprot:388-Eustigmatos_ZCMA.PRE.1
MAALRSAASTCTACAPYSSAMRFCAALYVRKRCPFRSDKRAIGVSEYRFCGGQGTAYSRRRPLDFISASMWLREASHSRCASL